MCKFMDSNEIIRHFSRNISLYTTVGFIRFLFPLRLLLSRFTKIKSSFGTLICGVFNCHNLGWHLDWYNRLYPINIVFLLFFFYLLEHQLDLMPRFGTVL